MEPGASLAFFYFYFCRGSSLRL